MKYDMPEWVKRDRTWRKGRMGKKHRGKIKETVTDILITFLIFIIPLIAIYILAEAFFTAYNPPLTYAQEVEKVERNVVKAIVTAYTSSVDETDDRPWETASGAIAGHSSIACPERLKFGTRIKIKEKEYICDDRMNIKYRDREHFDIWKTTKKEAFAWGRQNIEVEIL